MGRRSYLSKYARVSTKYSANGIANSRARASNLKSHSENLRISKFQTRLPSGVYQANLMPERVATMAGQTANAHFGEEFSWSQSNLGSGQLGAFPPNH